MHIILISGFLGAGKTRFIKRLVKKTGKQFAIIENEFGQLDIDGNLLQAGQDPSGAKDEMKVWELTEGCICCSTNLNFSDSVLTIANSIDPDYLIVEPSGVALPSRIIQQLSKIVYERIKLTAPITLVDGTIYQQSRRDFPEYFGDQLDQAGFVLVSKSESFSQEDFLRIKQDLKLNPDVEFPLSHYDSWGPEEFDRLLNTELLIESPDKQAGSTRPKAGKRFLVKPKAENHHKLESMALTEINCPNPDQLVYRLEAMIRRFYGRIVRAKGYFKTPAGWLRFDLVDGSYMVQGSPAMPDERVVIIGQKLQRQALLELFTARELEGVDKAQALVNLVGDTSQL